MKNKRLWFRAKRYGWGWYPITWQGVAITLAYAFGIAFLTSCAIQATVNTTNDAQTFWWNYLPSIVLLSFIMIWICYKTGEKPGWRWNGKKLGK